MPLVWRAALAENDRSLVDALLNTIKRVTTSASGGGGLPGEFALWLTFLFLYLFLVSSRPYLYCPSTLAVGSLSRYTRPDSYSEQR